MTRLIHALGGRRPKTLNKARSRGKYGTRSAANAHGDRMLVAISMVDAAAKHEATCMPHAREPGRVHGHLGGHTEFINGRLVN